MQILKIVLVPAGVCMIPGPAVKSSVSKIRSATTSTIEKFSPKLTVASFISEGRVKGTVKLLRARNLQWMFRSQSIQKGSILDDSVKTDLDGV